MAQNIPEDKLSEIRNAADIVDVISARVLLKKAGKDYTGLCPFHSEKTPSFTVSPEKQIFHCFGCGTGGDLFNFLMFYENMSFPEAVETLSRQYGIALPSEKQGRKEKQRHTERQHLLEINRRVMAFYREMLLKRPEGESARQYLKNRNTPREIADRFALGFAPGGWDNLVRFLNQRKIPLATAEKAGLVAPRQSGGYYDRFRNRIIFPISDTTGQVVGFGGRVLDDSRPKYLNSPETPLYNKRRILYGLHAAREACRSREKVFIVEGYFDLITMHQHGIVNTVATLGTALTRDHIRRLKGYAKKALLVFDSDAGGIKAAQRTTGTFMDEGMDAAVVLLPEGHDPDSFLFQHGADAFCELSENALGLVDFQIRSAIDRNGTSLEGKIRIITEMAAPLAEISDSAARSIYIQYLADQIGVDETTIFEKIKAYRGRKRDAPAGRKNFRSGEKAPAAGSGADRLEARMIAMMLQYPDILEEIRKQDIPRYFGDPQLKAIAEKILRMYPHETGSVAEFINRLDDEHQRREVSALCIEEAPWGEHSCRMLLSQFLNARKRRENDLPERIRAAEKNGDQELVTKLLTERQNQMANRRM